MNYLDLFSGLGGFHLGLKQAGFKFKWTGFSEIDKYATQIYKRRFPDAEELGSIIDIRPETLPKIDIVTFGFPCQDLSIAGKRKGLAGNRSGLFYSAMGIINIKRPQVFLWENVAGLLSSNNGKDVESVCDEMTRCGYLFDFEEQNTRWFLPQNRLRIYCIGVDILWIGKLLTGDAEDGLVGKMNLFETIMTGYLSSKLQQNLSGLQNLHEQDSIGLVLNWLVERKLFLLNGQKVKSKLLEIMSILESAKSTNLFLDTLVRQLKQKGISLGLSGKENQQTSHKDMMLDMNQKEGLSGYIERLLKKISDENLKVLKLCIISTWIKTTIKSATFTCAEVNAVTELFITALTDLHPNLLKMVLLDLTEHLENMKYAENRRDQSKNEQKNSNAQLSIFETEGIKNDSERHLREKSRPKVFPFRESDFNAQGERKGFKDGVRANAIDSNYYKGPDGKRTMIQYGKGSQDTKLSPLDGASQTLNSGHFKQPKIKIGTLRTHKDGEGFRQVKDDCCPTVPARAREDGSGQPVIEIKANTSRGYETAEEGDSINFLVPTSKTRRGRVGKGVAQTLDTACNQGVVSSQIRRLTPTECERLQGFPDGYTEFGSIYTQRTHPELINIRISDTQRYKTLGNAVSVPVVKAIGERLLT